MQQLGRVPGEELVAPQALVAELPGAADADLLADAEILAHLLGPPLVQRALDRMLRAAVEHGDERLTQQVADRSAGHRAARIDVGELDAHLAARAAVLEEIPGAAPARAEV